MRNRSYGLDFNEWERLLKKSRREDTTMEEQRLQRLEKKVMELEEDMRKILLDKQSKV